MVRGQGMPSFRHHDFGNLYIHFDVKFPPQGFATDPADFDALAKILPKATPAMLIPNGAITEDFVLEDVDASQQARAEGTAMDEDDEDGHPGAERVQCASQ